MSGICALLDSRGAAVDEGLLSAITSAASHRGPDGVALVREPGIGVASLALHATAESAGEPQPHRSAGGLIVIADARLDDRRALEASLRSGGHLGDPAPGDAELIAAAYRRWGVECPDRLLGDFAFALWDGPRRRLFGARDPLGVKPLHYVQVDGAIAVASEAQQLLRHSGVEQGADPIYLARFLIGLPGETGRSPYRAIRALPAGHRMVVEDGEVRLARYWQPDAQRELELRGDDEYAERCRELLDAAVQDRLRTQGKTVGIQLSGGLDSSAVAASACQVVREMKRAPGLLALSAVFRELPACDESSYIQATVHRLGLPSLQLPAEALPLLGEGEELGPDRESPFVGWTELERRMLAGVQDRGGRVVLTGQGGDFLFHGPTLVYRDQLRQARWGSLVRDLRAHARRKGVPLRRLLYLYLLRPGLPQQLLDGLRAVVGRGRERVPGWIDPTLARRAGLVEAARRRSRLLESGGARQAHLHQVLTLLDFQPLFSWNDRVAGRFGIEVRHPLLDRRLVEFALAVPSEQHYRAGVGKRLLRQAMRGRLPEEVRTRQDKTSFWPYLELGLIERLGSTLEKLFESPRLAELGVVDARTFREAAAARLRGQPSEAGFPIWRAATAELWLRRRHSSAARNGFGERPVPASAATCQQAAGVV